MITIKSGEWVANLTDMTCRNINTRIVVEFHKSGAAYAGKIKDMPFELLRRWSTTEHGEQFIKKVIMEAEKVFLRSLIESDIERKEST